MEPPGSSMTRAWRYATLGVVLGWGAPLGLMALRRLFAKGRRQGLRRELASDRLTYSYLAGATCIVFGAFGWALGRRADRLIESHREIDRLRDEFAAVIAHDLRSPVNALRLQSQLLLQQAAGADEVRTSKRAIERIQHATGALAQMIDDLLDASRVQSRRLALHPEACALDELVNEIIERQRAALGRHPVEIRSRPSPRALVDPHRFSQILINLLDNAVKYSDEERPIVVFVDPGEDGVTVRVEDRGWGIAAQELPRLFDRFYQAKRAREKKSGLGLGLYIVKGLVEAHGGRISVASPPGQGSSFSVWFPAAG
jgi:signal transduction histidine kinase